MTDAFRVRGVDDLERLGRMLKETGDKELKKELLAGVRKEGKPAVKAVKDSIGDYVPQSGGAADAVRRSTIGVRTTLSGKNVGIRIRGTGRQVQNLKRINAGFLRHPVFGNRDAWVDQRIKPGFFDEPLMKRKDDVTHGIKRVLDDIAARIERRA